MSKAMAMGRSPASSAAFLMMALEIPVFWMTRANMAPNTTRAMAEDSRMAPPNSTSLAQVRKGSPATQAIHAAMRGSASRAGRSRMTMSAAKRTKPPKSKTPENVIEILLNQSFGRKHSESSGGSLNAFVYDKGVQKESLTEMERATILTTLIYQLKILSI